MGEVYVISDLHFSHLNMAIKRGFKGIEDHDQHIIDCWNNTVNKGDTVWILGDISMEKVAPYSLLNELKGFKKVVLGNHDMPNHAKVMLNYVNSVSGMVRYKKDIILTHCPVHPFEIERFRVNVHGHVHENTIDDKRYKNVSAEVINYTPIKMSSI